MDVNLRDPAKRLAVTARMTTTAAAAGLTAIPMSLSESLPEYGDARLKNALRVKSASVADGAPMSSPKRTGRRASRCSCRRRASRATA